MNIIADVAGQYDAVKRLLKKMPEEETWFLGDLCDRGPKSKKVLEFVATHHKSLLGNHEHMLIDYLRGTFIYDDSIYLYNGGIQTLENYGYKFYTEMRGFNEVYREEIIGKFPDDTLKWLESLPVYYENENVFLSHAPWYAGTTLEKAQVLTKFRSINGHSLIWCRDTPKARDKLQVFGHNSHWGLKYFGELDRPWAICLDQSRHQVVTGLHLPSMQVYTEPY